MFSPPAWGLPTPDSDVDLLVVMQTRNQVEQAVRIDEAIEERGLPLDLLVYTPRTLETRLRWGDSFLQEIMARGKVLHEKDHRAVAAQRYAVEYRYPGLNTTARQAHAAYHKAALVCQTIRKTLGLPAKPFR